MSSLEKCIKLILFLQDLYFSFQTDKLGNFKIPAIKNLGSQESLPQLKEFNVLIQIGDIYINLAA